MQDVLAVGGIPACKFGCDSGGSTGGNDAVKLSKVGRGATPSGKDRGRLKFGSWGNGTIP